MKIVPNVKRGPAAGRSARRTGERPATRTPDPDRIRQAVGLLATFPAQMGLVELSIDDGAELDVTVDPDAATLGEIMLRLLADPDEAPATAAVRQTGQRLGVLLDQREQLADNAAAATRLDGDLRDTDAWAGAREREAQDELYGILDELLDPARSTLSQTERDRLAVDAGEALKAREDERTTRLAERDRTLAAQAEANAELQAAGDETHLVETMLRLRRGQPVETEDLDQALATYEALDEDEAKKRPGTRRRPR